MVELAVVAEELGSGGGARPVGRHRRGRRRGGRVRESDPGQGGPPRAGRRHPARLAGRARRAAPTDRPWPRSGLIGPVGCRRLPRRGRHHRPGPQRGRGGSRSWLRWTWTGPCTGCCIERDAVGPGRRPGQLRSVTALGATGSLDGAVVPPERVLAGATAERIRELALVVSSAEAVGGARWCLDTAAEHARTRQQFGRPIGQFQGVKHRLADMLVTVEQGVAATWDAAWLEPCDGARPAPRRPGRLAVQLAAALALDGYVEAAKGAIQVLGGMGFTWEHDAHIHLRRATTLRQLVGGTAPLRAEAARLALAGRRRAPDRRAAARGRRAPGRAHRVGGRHRRHRGPARAAARPGRRRAAGPALARPVGARRRCRRAAGHRPGVRRGRAPPAQPGRGRRGPCPPSWPTGPPSRPSGGWARRCGASSSGASCSASPAPAPTWPR